MKRIHLFDLLALAARQLTNRLGESFGIVFALGLGVGLIGAVTGLLSAVRLELNATLQSPEFHLIDLIATGEVGSVFDEETFLIEQRSDARTVRQLPLSLLAELTSNVDGVTGAYIAQNISLSVRSISATAFVPVRALAVTEQYKKSLKLNIVLGVWMAGTDFRSRSHVALISQDMARRLNRSDVLGQRLDTGGGSSYTVVGVFERAQPFGAARESERVDVIIPFGADQMGVIDQVHVSVKEGRESDVFAAVSAFASSRFGSAVRIRSRAKALTASSTSLSDATRLTVLFTSIGLLAVVVNLMNMFLVRALRRQRAVGISKAIGADNKAVAGLMLTEAAVLGALGGVIGVLIARILLFGLELLNSSPDNPSRIPFSWLAIGLSGIGAIVISLVAGIYPAFISARLNSARLLRS
jgi:ABC-type antimicrobial peptide transport system permease subunit